MASSLVGSEGYMTCTNIKLKKISRGSFMFSLDIKNMYPSLPTNDEAIDIIKSFMLKHAHKVNMFGFKIEHILEMIKCIFQNNYIRNGDNYYTVREAHSSTSLADMLVDFMYCRAIMLENYEPKVGSYGVYCVHSHVFTQV